MYRLRTTRFVVGALSLALSFVLLASVSRAQSTLSVSITPPLFQLEIGPGDSWTSSVKVVNNNPVPVTYYAQLADFEARDESGNATLIPLVGASADSQQSFSLASWITISKAPITVPAGGATHIPFAIHVPQNAEPGGHYGAILIGTVPPNAGSGTRINVSSFVSSLLFVRIKGNAIERGRIREFSTSQTLYTSPQAHFVLRFENTGTTHVKPVGDITIYNMWGKERGKVTINQDTGDFGNVLPTSTRRFEFSWEGEENPFDIGEYSAVVTLQYGENGKKNVSATTYFWVVPVVPVLLTLASLVLLIALMAFFIRRYIRRALSLERMRLQVLPGAPREASPHMSAKVLMEPIREGVIDLRSAASGQSGAHTGLATTPQEEHRKEQRDNTMRRLVRKYRLFLLFLAALIASGLIVSDYLDRVLVKERTFQITNVHLQVEASSTP